MSVLRHTCFQRRKFKKFFYLFYRSFSELSKNDLKTSELPDFFHGPNLETIQSVREHFEIIEDFVSEDEECNFMEEIEPIFKRRKYQFDHWDGAIHGYKETEKLDWNAKNSEVIKKLQEIAFPKNSSPLSHVHVLDLSEDGLIKPHVDSIKFCGDIIAGISLLSSSVMRLSKKETEFVDILLKRRSLYVMKGPARYDFSHEILGKEHSFFGGVPVPRQRRVSIICRIEPPQTS